jgi:hypothetical protein
MKRANKEEPKVELKPFEITPEQEEAYAEAFKNIKVTHELKSCAGDGLLLRQPIMYFYNFTGLNQQLTIDFNNLKIVESYPAVRTDNRVVFTVDQDGFVDSKYDYFYYEIALEKTLTKPEVILYFSNDKNLITSLNNLALVIGLMSDEIKHFVQFANFELKKSDTKFWKIEVFSETKLNAELPITIYPEPDYFIRRYVKFTPSNTGNKTNTKFGITKLPYSARTGKMRIVEWGILINDAVK